VDRLLCDLGVWRLPKYTGVLIFQDVFSPSRPARISNPANSELFEYTKGLPRDVIKVADDVLRHLMAHNKKQITIAEIEAIIQENHLSKAP
jgi:hypothetical protein